MPFDPTFTDAEFEAAIATDPKILERVTPVLAKQGFTVRDRATEQSYIAGLENQHVSAHTSKIATEVEKEIKELTGIEKLNPQEKWTDYYPRAVKATAQQAKDLSAEIAVLKNSTDLSKAEREQLKALEQLQKENTTSIDTMKIQHEQQLNAARAESKILLKIGGERATFDKAIPDDLIDMRHEGIIEKMLSVSIIDPNTGKVMFKGEDGKVMLNPDGSTVTELQYYRDGMKSCYDKAKQVTGAGGQAAGSSANNLGDVPGGAKTQPELSQHLIKSGLVGGSEAYNIEFNKWASKLPRR